MGWRWPASAPSSSYAPRAAGSSLHLLTCHQCATVAATYNGLGPWYAEYVLAVIFAAFALFAHAFTITQTAVSYLGQLRRMKSTDPLKPYLM